MNAQLDLVRQELASLKAEKQRLEEVAAEAERGTAKGRTYEEAVAEALDAIARRARATTATRSATSRASAARKGDVVVALDACAGPARGRIVFEAKNSQALQEAGAGRAGRGDGHARRRLRRSSSCPPTTSCRPRRTTCASSTATSSSSSSTPRTASASALEVAYKLARARVLMARGDAAGVDPAAVRAEVERALGAMEDVRRVKSQLTQATTYIGEATKIVDALAANVRGHLGQIDVLLRTAEDAAADDDVD